MQGARQEHLCLCTTLDVASTEHHTRNLIAHFKPERKPAPTCMKLMPAKALSSYQLLHLNAKLPIKGRVFRAENQ